MRIVLFSVGTRGDATPAAALAQELLQDPEPHSILWCLQQDMIPSLTERLDQSPQIQLLPLPFGNQDYYSATRHSKLPHHPNPRLAPLRSVAAILQQLVLPCMELVLDTLQEWNFSDDDDDDDAPIWLVSCALTRPLVVLLHRALPKSRILWLHLQPLQPNDRFPLYRTHRNEFVRAILRCEKDHDHEDKTRSYRDSYQLLEVTLTEFFLQDTLQEMADRWSLDMRRPVCAIPVNAYSNLLIPPLSNAWEVGPLAVDYPPRDRAPPPRLEAFWKNRRPIVVGFGSMAVSHREILWETIERLPSQSFLLVGRQWCQDVGHWKDKERILCLPYVPYAHVLSHCQMMICHGGAGVVHACLHAGIPAVVCPVLGDQFAWGALLQAKGWGVLGADSLSRWTTEELVRAIGAAEECLPACQEVGRRARDEPRGVQVLVERMKLSGNEV